MTKIVNVCYHKSMRGDERFSLSEAAAITGAPRSSTIGWLNRGLLRPARAAHGSGSRRLFGLRDLLWIAIAYRLTSFGVRAEQAARFADEVSDTLLADDARWCVFTPGEYGFEFAVVPNARDLGVILEPFGRPGPDAAIVIDGGRLLHSVREKAARLLEGGSE